MLTALPTFVPLPDVLMLLMTDVLVFLQEKDQKYIFPTLVRPSASFLSTDWCFRPFLVSYLSPKNPGVLWSPIAMIVPVIMIK